MIMAEKKREKDPSSSSSSMSVSDALLFTTMCMVGLSVEVQVKDGSLYSGIFHTASLDNGYGVILKKARKIGKGRHETSFTIGSLIDTLVVFSDDLVQIVVKDILLPVERFVGNLAGSSMEAATRKIESQDCMLDSERDPKPLTPGNNSPMRILDPNKERVSIYGPTAKNTWFEESAARKVLPSHLENTQVGDTRGPIEKVVEKSVSQFILLKERQVGKDMPQGEANSCYHMNEASEAKKTDQEDHCLSSNDACPTQADSAGERHGDLTSNSHGTRCCTTSPQSSKQDDILDSVCLTSTSIPSSDVQTSTVSSSSTLVSNSKTSSCPTLSESSNVRIYKKNSSCVTSAKEFKLNPGAKVFSPSPPNSRTSPPTALPTITSAGYMSNIPSVLPIAITESGVEFSSFATRASVPTKVIHYNSLVNGTTGAPAQYARHVVGHAAVQQQPIRYSGHYHSLQAGPTYLHPSPQVMVGRTSQVVYVHPTAQDAFQGASVFPQGSPYPVLNPSCQANMPKFQGGFQTFVAPSNAPIPQPFSAIRTTLAPGGNGFFARIQDGFNLQGKRLLA